MPLQKGDNPYYAAETMPRKPKNPGIRFGYNQYLNEKRMETSEIPSTIHPWLDVLVTINTSMKRGWKLHSLQQPLESRICQLLQSIPQ